MGFKTSSAVRRGTVLANVFVVSICLLLSAGISSDSVANSKVPKPAPLSMAHAGMDVVATWSTTQIDGPYMSQTATFQGNVTQYHEGSFTVGGVGKFDVDTRWGFNIWKTPYIAPYLARTTFVYNLDLSVATYANTAIAVAKVGFHTLLAAATGDPTFFPDTFLSATCAGFGGHDYLADTPSTDFTIYEKGTGTVYVTLVTNEYGRVTL
jgi:hypothetical protein